MKPFLEKLRPETIERLAILRGLKSRPMGEQELRLFLGLPIGRGAHVGRRGVGQSEMRDTEDWGPCRDKEWMNLTDNESSSYKYSYIHYDR